jgi:hypothetical protein
VRLFYYAKSGKLRTVSPDLRARLDEKARGYYDSFQRQLAARVLEGYGIVDPELIMHGMDGGEYVVQTFGSYVEMPDSSTKIELGFSRLSLDHIRYVLRHGVLRVPFDGISRHVELHTERHPWRSSAL